MRVLTCIGDVKDMSTHSGSNYRLWRAGLATGFFQDAWRLYPERLRAARLWWNFKEVVTTGRYGGFQYTREFLDALQRQESTADVTEIVSRFQLFPDHSMTSAKLSFYIDTTLTQLFDDYGVGATICPRVAKDALRREQEQYSHAHQIVCLSKWTARSVMQHYDVPLHKVHIVRPGANLELDGFEPFTDDPPPISEGLRLAFVGKDWRRKNLPFLLDVADELRRRKYHVEVVAAGFDPRSAPTHAALQTIGFLDKRRGMGEFVRFVRSCHFTCLFSSAEAFGISNLESLRLGVPVLAWDVGGIAESVPQGLGTVFPRAVSPADVATALERYLDAPEAYDALRREVAARVHEHTWAATLEAFGAIWGGSTAYQYRGD